MKHNDLNFNKKILNIKFKKERKIYNWKLFSFFIKDPEPVWSQIQTSMSDPDLDKVVRIRNTGYCIAIFRANYEFILAQYNYYLGGTYMFLQGVLVTQLSATLVTLHQPGVIKGLPHFCCLPGIKPGTLPEKNS